MDRIGRKKCYYEKQKCYVCGKKISVTPEWVYKKTFGNNRIIYYCSWTCYRKEEKRQEERYGKGRYKCRCCGEIKGLPDMLSKQQCWDCHDRRFREYEKQQWKKTKGHGRL